MTDMRGQVALVTGAASGIGKAVATRLAAEGATVIATDLREAEGRASATESGATLFLQHNVADEAQWEAVMRAIASEWGRLDALVNNAGTGRPGNPETTSFKDWKLIFSVNADGVFLGCKHAIPLMRAGGGAIVNISSCAAFEASPQLAAYGASKAAVEQLTKSVAVHCAREGLRIRCNAVHPGPIYTDLMRQSVEGAKDPEAQRREWLQGVPLGRFGTPEEIAAVVRFLLSEEASYVTGASWAVDGATTAA